MKKWGVFKEELRRLGGGFGIVSFCLLRYNGGQKDGFQMRTPLMSKQLFELLAYFAVGGMAYSDKLPEGLPNPELLPVLVEQKLVDEIMIHPNELIWHREHPNRISYYVISAKGLELYSLEKEARDDRAQEKAERAAERAADRAHADENRQKQFRHDWRIAIFSAVAGFVLGAIADHFVDIVGNALRFGYFLFH